MTSGALEALCVCAIAGCGGSDGDTGKVSISSDKPGNVIKGGERDHRVGDADRDLPGSGA